MIIETYKYQCNTSVTTIQCVNNTVHIILNIQTDLTISINCIFHNTYIYKLTWYNNPLIWDPVWAHLNSKAGISFRLVKRYSWLYNNLSLISFNLQFSKRCSVAVFIIIFLSFFFLFLLFLLALLLSLPDVGLPRPLLVGVVITSSSSSSSSSSSLASFASSGTSWASFRLSLAHFLEQCIKQQLLGTRYPEVWYRSLSQPMISTLSVLRQSYIHR